MAQWSELRQKIIDRTGVQLQAASEADMAQLEKLNVPDEVLAFFREAEPADYAEIEKVRLLPITVVIEENARYVPGYIRSHGYVVFATTLYGDTYCFDLNSPVSETAAPIVLVSHEMVGEDTTKDELKNLAKPIAADFDAFLEAYVGGTLDITPNYE